MNSNHSIATIDNFLFKTVWQEATDDIRVDANLPVHKKGLTIKRYIYGLYLQNKTLINAFCNPYFPTLHDTQILLFY
jgi:hypothetical protein